MRAVFAVIRFVVAAAIVAAIVGQLMTSLAFWATHNVTDVPLALVDFFSFFTIESNVAAIAVMLIGAVLLFARKGTDPRWFNVLRGVIVTYMAVTGIVYNLLLRNVELPQGATLEWSNEILHVVGPVWLVLDWFFAPGRGRLEWRDLWKIVVFPIVWVVYTLLRGPFTPNEVTGQPYWYPYPFLNPHLSANGYLSVSFYVILVAVVIALVGAGVILLSRRGAAAKAA